MFLGDYMDITTLDFNFIELFSIAYSVSKQVFEVDPLTTTPKFQKKIRKWINKTYIKDNDLPKKVLKFADDSKSDLEFIEFIAECFKYVEEKGTLKKQLFNKVSMNFSQDVKKAFIYLIDDMVACQSFESEENKVIFTLDEFFSYRRKLILHTTEKREIKHFDIFNFDNAQILKDENGYSFICEATNCEEDITEIISIPFKTATTQIDIYRADRRDFSDSPWETLSLTASDILEKSNVGEEYFNQKELNLMPLLKELRALSLWAPLFPEERPNFTILKQYVVKYNLLHLIPLLDKIANWPIDKPISLAISSNLRNKFNESICEALWRELYELVSDSQQGYAEEIILYDQCELNKTRVQIEKKFHSLGYEGTYPNFRKNGAIKNIRIEESYNQSYFIAAEKNVEFIVECRELMCYGMLQIQFMCGTALLKKGESIVDIYNCCFNKKGRSFFKTFYWNIENTDLLDEFVTIAAKKAECIKLNKKEKELIKDVIVSWQNFVLTFIFAGGLFAALMTAIMFLISCLITVVVLDFGSILEMIKEIPWWLIFIIGFVGFGGGMAIVEAIAKKK